MNVKKKTAFRSVSAEYVTDDSGVGIVHLAPAFGEDDYSVCLKHGIIQKGFNIVCPVDDNGRFTKEVPEFVGRHVKEADKDIIALLKKNGRLVVQGAIVHSYPFCWRSETPLIYRAVPSWFVRVEQIKEKLLACNSETYWVPSFVKEKRFHNWLQDAKDWAISRNRFWGTPIPIWMSDDAEEIVVVGSIEELERLTGAKNVNDLHKDKIDHLTIPSSKGKGVLKRIPEVFDCWFESGSMPYAQLHYPFENKEVFENGFPADFIAEGLDQTRGWFYTLMVISTALYGKPAFKNLIVNGLVLAADGKKMSKRLKNYPDPMEVVKKYGADALRLYLINSPAVRAEPLRFQESGVFDLIKRVFLPWFHSYRFFVENTLRFEHVFKQTFTANPALKYSVNNVMDKWILSSLQSLIGFVHDEMKAYRLYTVVPELVVFIENLTNWYVRMNRKRLKGAKGKEDTLLALNTLFEVLITLCKIMAPFTPFLVEMMYQNLKQVLPADQQSPSVHFLLLPIKDEKQIDPKVEIAVKRMQNVVEDGRCARDKRAIGLKQPLPRLIVCHRDINFINDLKSLSHYISEECNVQTVEFELDVSKWALLKLEINQKNVGPRVGKKLKAIKEAAEKLSHADVEKIQEDKKWVIEGETLSLEDIEIKWVFKSAESSSTAEEKVEEKKEETTPKGEKGKKKEKPEKGAKGGKGGAAGAGKKENESVFQPSQEKGSALVILDTTYVLELVQQGLAREVINRIQKLRKIAELVPTDPIEIFYTVKKGSELESAIIGQSSYLSQVVSRPIFEISHLPSYAVIIAKQDSDIDGEPITITLTRPTLFFNDTALSGLGFSNEFIVSIKNALLNKEWINFQSTVQKLSSPIVSFNLDGKNVTVKAGEHFYFTGAEAFKH